MKDANPKGIPQHAIWIAMKEAMIENKEEDLIDEYWKEYLKLCDDIEEFTEDKKLSPKSNRKHLNTI